MRLLYNPCAKKRAKTGRFALNFYNNTRPSRVSGFFCISSGGKLGLLPT